MLTALFIDAEIKVFDDEASARAWLAESAD